MSHYDPRVESQADHICHMVGENEGLKLSDKSRHDVFFTVRAVANYWKKDSDKLREQNHAKRWNELNIWLRENPDATVKDIQKIMQMLDSGLYIRNCKVRT